mmetsp:Transcript_6461/g.11512  ORF Transcript_6461/g.11512 Transcript_6461/m.11512 type:complete len:314 (+) Transcript_6461:7883-8824(+)
MDSSPEVLEAEAIETCTTALCDIVGLVMTVLQLGQVLPQHYEMWAEKSTVGVSAFLLLFGSLYTYLAALDVVLTGSSFLQCNDGFYRCVIDIQPWFQMVFSAVFTITLWYWYLKYHKAPHDEIDLTQSQVVRLEGTWVYDGGESHSGWRFFWSFLIISAVFTIVGAFIYLTFGENSQLNQNFSHLCGLLSAVLNGVMWLPQIYTTYKFQRKGALSKEWVLFSVIMDVVYSVYLAAMGLDFSVWANNIPDGVQTMVLFVMILVFERREYLETLESSSVSSNTPLVEEDFFNGKELLDGAQNHKAIDIDAVSNEH